MTPERVPAGWRASSYGKALIEQEERAGGRLDLPVLSVTKTRGLMLASERFSKVLHSRDLSRYRVARRNMIVADPMLLWDGSIGIQRVVDAGLVSPDYRVYAPGDDADPAFMAYVVRSPTMLSHYQGGARGTNVRRNRIARSDFLQIPLALPPLAEQHKIVAILSSVDEAIESTQAVINQLQVVKKSMMAEFLTRGLPGLHTRFKQTEIGEAPEDWTTARISELGEPRLGRMRSPVYTAGRNRPYLRVANVLDGRIDVSDVLEMPFEDDSFEQFRLKEGDILLNEGQSLELVGRSAIYQGDPPDCAFQKTLLRFRAGPRIGFRFAQFLFQWCLYSGRFAEHAVQTTSIAHLTGVRFAAMQMPVPPLAEQDGIVNVLSAVDARRQVEEESMVRLRELKHALAEVLLTGDLRVTPDEPTP